MSHPVIDMAGIVFDAEGWEEYLHGFAQRAPNYLHVFERRLAAMTGIDRGSYRHAFAQGPDVLAKTLVATGTLGVDIDDHVGRLVGDGICHQVMLGLPAGNPNANNRLAALAARHPSRLSAWAGLDLDDTSHAARELQRCVRDLGMSGGTLVHFMHDVDPLAVGCHEVYETAARLGVPLWLHVGHNLSRTRPIDVCTWRHVDAIATAHPDLVIVCGHAGWPWVLDTIAVCQRHPNVYLEFSTHRASQMARPGSGWEPLLNHGRTTIRAKVLFGSVEWAHGLTERQLADEVAELDIGADVAGRWLHDNAHAVLGLQRHTCDLVPADAGEQR